MLLRRNLFAAVLQLGQAKGRQVARLQLCLRPVAQLQAKGLRLPNLQACLRPIMLVLVCHREDLLRRSPTIAHGLLGLLATLAIWMHV